MPAVEQRQEVGGLPSFGFGSTFYLKWIAVEYSRFRNIQAVAREGGLQV